MVCWERNPFDDHRYRPDLIGVNRTFRMIEVELKSSVADFKANGAKRGIRWQMHFPSQFYFCVPPELVDRVKSLLPVGAGLLTIGAPDRWGPTVEVGRGAKVNPNATRLSKYAVARMVSHQSASLHRACLRIANGQLHNDCGTTVPVR